jgi:hypothetical protein
MKFLPMLLAALLAVPVSSLAGEAVKIEIRLPGDLKQSVALVGPNSSAKFTSTASPNTVFELRLIAPEPLILDVRESTTDGCGAEAVGRITLLTPGSSFAVSEIKGAKFQNPYVVVRLN